MQMKKFAAFLAALMLVVGAFAPTALADKGKWGKVHKNPDSGEIQTLLLEGHTACMGTKLQNTCVTLSPVTGELLIQYGSRRATGVGTNFDQFRIVRATADAIVMTDETGAVQTTASKLTATENGNARMYTVLSSIFNGAAASGIAGAFCTINDCGGGGGAGASVAYAISGATAGAAVDAVLGGTTGTCGTGTCGDSPG